MVYPIPESNVKPAKTRPRLNSAHCTRGLTSLDQRLPRHAKSTCFTVKGIHHPSREVHIDPLRIRTDTPSLVEINVVKDFPARIKFAIKDLRFHKVPPPHPVIASRKSIECFRRAE
jgi:hypothetical protein